jgi:hypothetical protein
MKAPVNGESYGGGGQKNDAHGERAIHSKSVHEHRLRLVHCYRFEIKFHESGSCLPILLGVQ